MKITFDPAKDEWTRRERGFSLSLGLTVIRNQVASQFDRRQDYGEDRIISYGYAGDRLHVCVYTVRGDELRIISVRKANKSEVKKYG
jgi:uncharacterized protein